MARTCVFPEPRLLAFPKVGEPLVAFDPITGQSEIIVDHFPPDDPDEPLEIMLQPDLLQKTPTPTEPFRALVGPRRLRGVEARHPLMPGDRSARLTALRPTLESVSGGIAP